MRPLLRRAPRTLSTSNKPRLAALRQQLKSDTVKPPPPTTPGAQTFYIETRGCQMNVSDSEVVRTLLYEDACRAGRATGVKWPNLRDPNKAEQKVWTRPGSAGPQRCQGPDRAVLGCMAERVKMTCSGMVWRTSSSARTRIDGCRRC